MLEELPLALIRSSKQGFTPVAKPSIPYPIRIGRICDLDHDQLAKSMVDKAYCNKLLLLVWSSFFFQFPQSNSMASMVVSPNTAVNPSWYFNSVHWTMWPNLSIEFDYNGLDKLTMGNGHVLCIQNVSYSSLPSFFKTLHLRIFFYLLFFFLFD